MPQEISIPAQIAGDTLIVTVTNQNRYRYSKTVLIESPSNIVDGDNPEIVNFSLAQNYPNPFNPSTTIFYSLPSLSNVTLKVYDLLGNELVTLVNEQKPPGRYELEWNAENYPSGVYLYRLYTGNFSTTRKMMLLK